MKINKSNLLYAIINYVDAIIWAIIGFYYAPSFTSLIPFYIFISVVFIINGSCYLRTFIKDNYSKQV